MQPATRALGTQPPRLARSAGLLVLLYSLLIAGAIGIDAVLHSVGLAWVGRQLGWVGTALVLASFVYSLRKRRLIAFSTPMALLRVHEVLACAGALALLVHAGVHVHALLPWLAIGTMMASVASGMTGRVLLTRARRSAGVGADTPERPDDELGLPEESWAVGALGGWRRIHLPITLNFFVLASLHILAALLFR